MQNAWEYFASTYGGGPVLTMGDLCEDCVKEHFIELGEKIGKKKEKEEMVRMADRNRYGGHLGRPFLVSKAWIEGWHH